MSAMNEIEKFFGCYLLYCTNPKYKGQTYIGFTVDPNRRIQQHNKGMKAGGAWKTMNKGPWEMVLIIHGFPNDISALRFEWAWQHPTKSRRLNHLPRKRKSESQFEYRFRILSEMLKVGPWTRLPLTIRWLKQEYKLEFRPENMPPIHMPITYGPVKCLKSPTKKKKKKENPPKEISEPSTSQSPIKSLDLYENIDSSPEIFPSQKEQKECRICYEKNDRKIVYCISPQCKAEFHMVCLARHILNSEGEGFLLPVQGTCPICIQQMLWGDVIRYSWGCYHAPRLLGIDDSNNDEHWSSQLQKC